MNTSWITENTTDRFRGTMTHQLTFHTNSYARVLGLYLKDECPFGTLILPAEIIPREEEINALKLDAAAFVLAGYSNIPAELKQIIANKRMRNDWCAPPRSITYGPWLLVPAIERSVCSMRASVFSGGGYDQLPMRHWLLIARHLQEFNRHCRIIIGSPFKVQDDPLARFPISDGHRLESVAYQEPLQKDDYFLVADGPR